MREFIFALYLITALGSVFGATNVTTEEEISEQVYGQCFWGSKWIPGTSGESGYYRNCEAGNYMRNGATCSFVNERCAKRCNGQYGCMYNCTCRGTRGSRKKGMHDVGQSSRGRRCGMSSKYDIAGSAYTNAMIKATGVLEDSLRQGTFYSKFSESTTYCYTANGNPSNKGAAVCLHGYAYTNQVDNGAGIQAEILAASTSTVDSEEYTSVGYVGALGGIGNDTGGRYGLYIYCNTDTNSAPYSKRGLNALDMDSIPSGEVIFVNVTVTQEERAQALAARDAFIASMASQTTEEGGEEDGDNLSKRTYDDTCGNDWNNDQNYPQNGDPAVCQD